MKKDLLEWILKHIRQKDVFFKKIKSIEEFEDKVLVNYADRTDQVFSMPCFDDSCIDRIMEISKKNPYILVATLNKKENIDAMIKNWDGLSKITNLRIYFINMEIDDKWIISPHTHHKISERKSLRKGIVSLSQNIPLTP